MRSVVQLPVGSYSVDSGAIPYYKLNAENQ